MGSDAPIGLQSPAIAGATTFGWRCMLPNGILLAVVAFFVIRCSTASGILVTPDSAAYLSAADSLESNGTFTIYDGKRLSHYPPGYPLSLAFFAMSTPYEGRYGAPRMLNALGYSLFIGVVCVYFGAVANSIYFGTTSGVIAILSINLLDQYSTALSEGPFISASSVATFFFMLYIAYRVRWHLRICSLIIGYAFLVRFVGIVWIFAFALLLLLRRVSWRQFLLELQDLLLLAMLPMCIWVGSCRLYGLSATNRALAWHPVSCADVKYLLHQLLTFSFISGDAVFVMAGGCLVCTIVLFALRRLLQKPAWCVVDSTVVTAAVLISAYLSFIVFSRSFADRATPFDARILGPIAWLVVPVGCLAFGAWTWKKVGAGSVQSRGLAIGACLLLTVAGSIEDFLERIRINGRGEAALNAEIEADRLIHRWLANIESDTTIYSNMPWLPYLSKQIVPVLRLPLKADYTSGVANASYFTEVKDVERRLGERVAVVVYWTYQEHEDAYDCMSLNEILRAARGLEVHHYGRFCTVGIPRLTSDSTSEAPVFGFGTN